MAEIICTIDQGQLKGLQEKDIHGQPFFSFHGIPYAKAPVGKLRFKDPQEPDNWLGVRDATKEGNICLCKTLKPKEMVIGDFGSEDCLFLNIYTHKVPKITQNDFKVKPVMVFIHGGGFTLGSGNRDQFGPEILMTEDIVLVVINYRLGVFGFLSFDDPSLGAPGNAGLKDQVQALKWVKKNISAFGGDSGNVTIFGESAGAASVHYLVLSPLAEGLFHKAIAQSGTTLNPWAHGENSPRKLAEALGCSEKDERKIFEFLQSVPGTRILEGQKILSDWWDGLKKRPFSPCVEKKSANALIAEDPLKLILSGKYNKVPMIIGYNKDEGILVELLNCFSDCQLINVEEYVPYYFGYKKYDSRFKDINKKICQFYYGTDVPDLNNRRALYNILTDTLHLRGIYSSLKAHVQTSNQPLYFYRMSLDTKLKSVQNMLLIGGPSIKGAAHGDDLSYLFKSRAQEFSVEPGSVEETGYKRFVKMWTNFARTGRPIPEKDSLLNVDWKPVTTQELNFLDIGAELVPGTNPDIERMKFWDELYKDLPGH